MSPQVVSMLTDLFYKVAALVNSSNQNEHAARGAVDNVRNILDVLQFEEPALQDPRFIDAVHTLIQAASMAEPPPGTPSPHVILK